MKMALRPTTVTQSPESDQCWADVADGGPILIQIRAIDPCLLDPLLNWQLQASTPEPIYNGDVTTRMSTCPLCG